MPRFGFQADTFFSGEFCGANGFEAEQPVGQLHFLRQGKVTMVHAGSQQLDLAGPSLVLYPRPFAHRLVTSADSSAKLLCAHVSFREHSRNPFAQALPSCLVIPLDQLEGMGQVLDLMTTQALNDEIGQRFMMDRLCDILVWQMIRYALQHGKLQAGILAGFAEPRIGRVLAAIHADPAANWTLPRLVNLAAMSRSHFISKFHQLVGMTPAAYVVEWRLGLAEERLRQGQPVKAVAHAVGYRSQQSFTRAFAERTGSSPTVWRRLQGLSFPP